MSIEQRINRWKELYEPSNGKKIIRFLIEYWNPDNPAPVLNWENKNKRIEWAKRHYEWLVKNVDLYEDDSLPHLNPLTGTEIFAEAFGCKVLYPDNNMPFALPLVSDSAAASKLKVPRLEDTNLMILFDIMDELVMFAGKDALIRLPDVQSPFDIAALIWDKNDFFPSLIDEPEAIFEIAGKVKELLITFLDEWFKRYGKIYIAHFPNYYMEGGITMSVDELGCVSPVMFREFFTGEINELSNRYGGVGIHSCADSINQWDNLKDIDGLRLLNLHRRWDEIKPALDLFKNTCAQFHYVLNEKTDSRNITPGDIENDFPQSCKVVIPLSANDVNHAKKLLDSFEKWR